MFLIGLAALLLMAAFEVRAADDLPGRVGRVAEVVGQLFLSPEERPADWEAIGINYPITSGAYLRVSGDGRAEIDYGGGQFRLAGDTTVSVSRLDDSDLVLSIAQGQLIVRVRAQEPGDATSVDTPNTRVTLARPGLYRIEVTPDREATAVAVREGEAIVALAHGAQQALPGQAVSVVGASPAGADIRIAQGMDGFDAWSAERDRLAERDRRNPRAWSTAYVSQRMVGHADLDEYGSWQTYPDYGAVWFPTSVAPGWAPYRDGYWTEVGQWGPTWVDHAPWGYAPFHYGRWTYISGRWGWCPGIYVARPVWAPALVAWYGGANWALAVGRGAPIYGWVPLGWREVYHPPWRRCSFDCWARHNHPHSGNVTGRPTAPPPRYANLMVPGAMSAVAAPVLTQRRPVTPNLVQVPAPLVTSAPAMRTAPNLTPPLAPSARPMPPPANPGSSPPDYRSAVPAAAAPTSSGVPVGRVPPPTRVAPPMSPSLSGSVGAPAPRAAAPAAVAPVPTAQGQAATVAPAPAPTSTPDRGVRAGAERSVPDAPPRGTNWVR